MALRDALGRFIRRPLEMLSPAYRRRIERAEARGFSRSAAQGHSQTPTRAKDTAGLFNDERYERSLRVLSRMRDGETLTAASREEGIAPDTVRRHVGSAIERDDRGRFRPKAVDRLYRQMPHLVEDGYLAVEPADSREATKLSQYHHAIDRYLNYGDEKPLRRFRRMRLRLREGGSLPFLTDLDAIDRIAGAGQLQFSSIYRLVA